MKHRSSLEEETKKDAVSIGERKWQRIEGEGLNKRKDVTTKEIVLGKREVKRSCKGNLKRRIERALESKK